MATLSNFARNPSGQPVMNLDTPDPQRVRVNVAECAAKFHKKLCVGLLDAGCSAQVLKAAGFATWLASIFRTLGHTRFLNPKFAVAVASESQHHREYEVEWSFNQGSTGRLLGAAMCRREHNSGGCQNLHRITHAPQARPIDFLIGPM
jgi:hypothetical protein